MNNKEYVGTEDGNEDEAGNEEFLRGVAYAEGKGIECDHAEAFHWFLKAAEKENCKAHWEMGKCYELGRGVLQDNLSAFMCYKRAAKCGHIEAQVKVGMHYLEANEVDQNYERAIEFFKSAGRQGSVEAKYQLACIYRRGPDTCRDPTKALKLFNEAAIGGGHPAAIYEYGLMLCQTAAQKGNKEATFLLGFCYEQGIGLPKNEQKGVAFIERAAGKKQNNAKKLIEKRRKQKEWKQQLIALRSECENQKNIISETETSLKQEQERYKKSKAKNRHKAKENRELKGSLAEAREEIANKKTQLANKKTQLASKDKEIEKLRKNASKGDDLLGAPDSVISRWLLSYVDPEGLGLPKKIGTAGSGPHKECDFDEMIEDAGFTSMIPDGSNGIVVVGREDVEIDEFVDALGLDTGNRPKIYSQEMFMLLLMTGKDPFDAPPEVLYEFAEGHPVLEALMENEFEWPAIHERESSDEGVIVIDGQLWHSQSPLTAMGYHVGKTGLNAAQRRRILKKIMEHRLQFPRGFSASDKSEWGQAATSTRLEKIANHIAFNVSFRSTQSRYRYAVKDWKSDLAWLKKTYYHKMKRRFSWPGV